VVVDVRGWFWHRWPEHGSTPSANREWWTHKLDTNVRRDEDTDRRLTQNGWMPIVVWEHERPTAAADRIEKAVRSRQTS
jgi:DNA mismatch endonuclease (patch repair protein)